MKKIDYKTFFDFSRDSQIIIKNFKIIDCNKQTEKLLNKQKEEIINRDIFEFLKPLNVNTDDDEFKKKLHERFAKIQEKGYGEFEKILYNENNEKMFTLFRVTSVEDDEEQYFYAVIEDITKKISEENVFKKLKSNFRSLYEKSVIAIAFLDMEGNILDCNDYFNEMFNVDDVIYCKRFLDIFNINPKVLLDNGGIKKEVNLDEINKPKVSKQFEKLGIKYIEINFDIIRQNDKIKGFFVQIKDISKSKEYENKITQQNKLMQCVINNIPKGIIVKDVKNDFRYVYFNKSAKETLEIDKKIELKGRKTQDVFDEEITKLISKKDDYYVNNNINMIEGIKEYEYIIKGNAIKCTCLPVKNNNDEMVYLINMIEDVTELNKMNENEKQREKMAALGQLAGGVAHDFNNQLMSIIGNSMMIQKTEDIIKIKEYAERIVHISQSSANLTRKILLFSRKSNNADKYINMKTVLDNTLTIIESILDKRISIKYKYKASNIWIKGDESQIENVIINLALNSRDALKNGGIIEIKVEDEKYYKDKIMSHGEVISPGEYLKVSIEDDGEGMSQDTLSRIFEPYFSTKSKTKGTGLGLSVVFGTIKSHSGYINVESKENEGTIFEIYLPAKDKYKNKQTKNLVKINKIGNRIMLVDDDRNVLDIEAELFEDLGYEVKKFSCPKEALAYYKKGWNQIDFIVLDMIMPQMSGRRLYNETKKINPDIKAIFISGFSLQDHKEQVLKDGALAFIEKPFTFEEISSTLAKIY